MSANDFEGKTVLITGGGGGIGRATAARFLEEGANVVLSSRRQEVLDVAQRRARPDRRAVGARGRRRQLAERRPRELVEAAVDRFGSVDVLVNSTGIFRVVPVPRADRGRVGGGARLDPPPDLLHVAGRGPA